MTPTVCTDLVKIFIKINKRKCSHESDYSTRMTRTACTDLIGFLER